MARTYIISEICGDWALQIREPGHPHQFLYFNSENNADLVKSILEWEDEHPNEAVPYKPTFTPPNEWVSVDERLPRLRENVLVCAYWHEHWGVYMGWNSGHGWSVSCGLGQRSDVQVSHWMPLPEPPGKEG